MNYSEIYKNLPYYLKEIFISNSIGKTLVNMEGKRLSVKDVEQMNLIRRCDKSKEVKKDRSKKKAEVFTPAWIVNEQNNLVDNTCLCKDSVFSTSGKDFKCNELLDWEGCAIPKSNYIKQKRLEIACGECPYITTRYDTATGEKIDFENRVGFLDRKFKVALTVKEDKLDLLFDALSSCYGYEFQADNLIIARINIYLSCLDFVKKTGLTLTYFDTVMLARVITYNFFQLDGLENCEPFTMEEVYVKDWETDTRYKWIEMFKEQ